MEKFQQSTGSIRPAELYDLSSDVQTKRDVFLQHSGEDLVENQIRQCPHTGSGRIEAGLSIQSLDSHLRRARTGV